MNGLKVAGIAAAPKASLPGLATWRKVWYKLPTCIAFGVGLSEVTTMSLAAAAWVLLIIGFQPTTGYKVDAVGFSSQAACIAGETFLENQYLGQSQIYPPAQLDCIKN